MKVLTSAKAQGSKKKFDTSRRIPPSTAVRALSANDLAEKYQQLADKKIVIADYTLEKLKNEVEMSEVEHLRCKWHAKRVQTIVFLKLGYHALLVTWPFRNYKTYSLESKKLSNQNYVRLLLSPLYEELCSEPKNGENDGILEPHSKYFMQAGYQPCVNEYQDAYKKWMEAKDPGEIKP
nr:unnamed protein product [Callosobruchus analis]